MYVCKQGNPYRKLRGGGDINNNVWTSVKWTDGVIGGEIN